MACLRRLRQYREVAVSFLAMLAALLLLSVVQFFAWRGSAQEGLLTLARVMGSNSAGALAFASRSDAEEILAACRTAPAVLSASLVLADGRELASYEAGDAVVRVFGLPAPSATVSEAVRLRGRHLGYIEMTASLAPVYREVLMFFFSGFAIMSLGVLLAIVASAQLRRSVRDAEARMAYMAMYDTLTGLPNRNSFRDNLEAAVARWHRDGRGFAVLFVDCDGFKQVNDTYGHAVGDRVLVELARRLESSLRANDSVSRISGDEFVVIVDQPDGPQAVARIAEQLLFLMRQPVPVGDVAPAVGASIGIALVPEDGTTAGDLLHNADAAMYHAKQQGKNGFQFFSREIEARARERMLIEQDLREACAAGQFHLAYQPIVAIADGRVVALEALLRWQHPVRGAVSPGLFIPVAEESGLICDIGLIALRLVAEDHAWWRARGIAVPSVAVNVSFRQFYRTDGEARFLGELEALGLHPGMVEFELTESASVAEARSGSHLVERLQEAGYRLAIDDFGTGYSSMGALRQMKNAKLKIDQSLVRGIAEGGEARVIVSGILGMSRALSIPVVAEGVETAAELAALADLRCDYVQGFHLARPQRPADLVGILVAGRIPLSA